MPRADWVEANLFSVTVQCFHALGLLRFIAIWLHAAGHTAYYDFYDGLLTYIQDSGGQLAALWRSFREKYETSLAGDWNYHNEVFGNVTWFFEEGAFLELITDETVFDRELIPYLTRFAIPEDLFGELLRYQKLMLRGPFDGEKTERFSYDRHAFFDSVIKTGSGLLRRKPNAVTAKPNRRFPSLPQYAKETVWFGRRRGATVYRDDELTVVYPDEKGENEA